MFISNSKSLFWPLSQLTTGLGDPLTLHVSLIVWPIFVVQSDSADSNTGGPVEAHKQKVHMKHLVKQFAITWNKNNATIDKSERGKGQILVHFIIGSQSLPGVHIYLQLVGRLERCWSSLMSLSQGSLASVERPWSVYLRTEPLCSCHNPHDLSSPPTVSLISTSFNWEITKVSMRKTSEKAQ